MREPAYPLRSWTNPNNGDTQWGSPGLTKRELFAAMAMQGLLSNQRWTTENGRANTSGNAVAQADSLIAALEEK